MSKIKGFKGYDKNLKCRDYQFEVGKDYETDKAKACESGFHFCEYPLDVFGYYPPASSRYTEVEGSGKTDKHDGDSKVACTKIRIGAEFTIAGIIDAAVKFVFDRVEETKKTENKSDKKAASNSGDYGAASNSGAYGAASNSGFQGAASNSGFQGAASNSGDYGAASNSGSQGAASNSGAYGAASNSGDYGAASNSGSQGAASNSGAYGAASNSGAYGAASNSGFQGAASNSGFQGAASNSGDYGAASNSGSQGAAFSSGTEGSADTKGSESAAVSIGILGRAKGDKGCWIVLSEWEQDKKYEWHRIDVQAVLVDGKKIKADTFYILQKGKFVEA